MHHVRCTGDKLFVDYDRQLVGYGRDDDRAQVLSLPLGASNSTLPGVLGVRRWISS
jgi:hypothetical protein